MNNVRLQLSQELFDLVITYKVVQRMNGTNQFVNDYYLIVLILYLFEQFAFGAYGGPGDEGDIVPALS